MSKKVEEYWKAFQKYVSAHNGTLLRQFDDIDAGYYRGLLHSTDSVKGALKLAKEFIDKSH
ncbi:MAG: hypothetical protein HZB54_07715 [Deltaproteobacteria bacterium]|nr:hypothetical protein [Deltaproteobacteria bacterium]